MTNNELDWAEELIYDTDLSNVKWFKLSNGKKFKYIGDKYGHWGHTSGWYGWYAVVGIELINGELCFLTSFEDKPSFDVPRYYIPISNYESNELSYNYWRGN